MSDTVKPLDKQPDLTSNIERKLLSLVDAAEKAAASEAELIDAKLYLQLADLYHFDKKYKKEVSILQRFTRFEHANSDEFVDIYDRIEHVQSLIEHTPEVIEESAPLSLVPDIKDEDHISISTHKEVKHRVQQGKIPFHQQTLKVLTLSAAYTGISDKDEIIQVAMVLFEYNDQRMKKGKILNTYWGSRKTRQAVPKKVANQFNFSLCEKDVLAFEKEKVLALVQQADFIVSHNDAEIERKLLATLVPEIAAVQWYSSERDIPWKAMGYDTQRLTQLAGGLGEKVPRTCMDRAMIISRILQKTEPFSTHVYLERLYNMQPMKPFDWTAELQKQKKRMQKSESASQLWIALGITLTVAIAVGTYLYFSGVFSR